MTTRVLLVGPPGLIGRLVDAEFITRPDTVVTRLSEGRQSVWKN